MISSLDPHGQWSLSISLLGLEPSVFNFTAPSNKLLTCQPQAMTSMSVGGPFRSFNKDLLISQALTVLQKYTSLIKTIIGYG